MNRSSIRILAAFSVLSAAFSAHAQNSWSNECIDPANTAPYSTDFRTNFVGNDLMSCIMGLSGTVTYGGQNGPCYAPSAMTANAIGRFAFFYGPTGSIQRSSRTFSDNNLNLTFGAPFDPIWCYAATTEDTTRTMFGANGLGTFFVGFSNRYMYADSVNGNLFVRCQVECVADAVRLRWRITNQDPDNPHNVGLHFGSAVAMLIGPFGSTSNSESGSVTASGTFPPVPPATAVIKPGFVVPEKGRPIRTDREFDRTTSPGTFPEYVDFVFGQTDSAGFRIENSASTSTQDVAENQASTADHFWIGKAGLLLGAPSAATANFPLGMLPDTEMRGNVAFVQRFPAQPLAAGATVQFLHYVRSTWGQSDYKLPYGVAVDGPRTVSTLATDYDGNPTPGGIYPNPMPIRVYVDNVGGYAFDGTEFPLNDVRITLKFAPTAGITVAGADSATPYQRELVIPSVGPWETGTVNFTATVGGDVAGAIPYTVEVFSQPGNVRKTINAFVNVASRARMQLYKDANMVSVPYVLANTSCDAVFEPFLDPNVPGGDAHYYKWDPIQKSYVIVNSVPRGEGFFVIYDKAGDSSVFADYGGAPTAGAAFLEGSELVQLYQGYNMIGNPFNYRIPISQIAGVSASAPQISHTFAEMVDLGFVQSYLTTWDPVAKDYVFVPTTDGFLEPHRAYWINVLTEDPVTLNYPPVNSLFVPEMSRKPIIRPSWPQTNDKWRLRLSARSGEGVDGENYIANISDATDMARNRIQEPPMTPTQSLGLAIEQQVNGQPMKMAQASANQTGRTDWKLTVTSRKAGPVTVNWPNLGTLPKNLRLRITDPATNVSRSLRQTSGYTFNMDKPGTRELVVTVEEGGTDAAVIANVVVSRPSRAVNAPFTISYTLGADSTTTVRVLSGTGKEVYVATRGRADRAGENSVTWNLRNSANQAVAPGVYTVEIVAESLSGDRMRRTVPVNVIR